MLADDRELVPRGAGRAADRDDRGRPPAGRRRGRRGRRSARSAAGSCSGSRRRTCPACSTSGRWGSRSATSRPPHSAATLDVATRTVAAGPPAGRAADPARDRRDGPVRRARAGLRQRRRRDVRARPASGRRTRRRPPTSPPRSPARYAGCSRSRARTRPCVVDADLRPEGRQGPLVRTLASYRVLLPALVGGVGGAGVAARRPAVRGRRAADGVRRADRPAAVPGERVARRRRDGDPPDQGPGGRRTAAARCRPGDAHQARSRRPGRHRVDRAAAAAARGAPGAGAAYHPDAGRAAGGGRRGPGRPPRTPTR